LFGKGATVKDVKLTRQVVGKDMGVKDKSFIFIKPRI